MNALGGLRSQYQLRYKSDMYSSLSPIISIPDITTITNYPAGRIITGINPSNKTL